MVGKHQDILITTTSTVEGMVVKKYLKPISAHLVAGTNLFSDLFASFNGIFSGQSKTYQNQISSLYNSSIEILKESARKVGANCVLGLEVDLDEISRKNKSMFMITAVGTAVIIEPIINDSKLFHETSPAEFLSLEDLHLMRKKKSLIKRIKKNEQVLDDETWEFLTVNRISEVIHEVLLIFYNKVFDYSITLENNTFYLQSYPKLLSYMESLSEEETTTILYRHFMDEQLKPYLQVILRLINDLMLFDSPAIESYLTKGNEDQKRKSLQLMVVEKPLYTREDIQVFEKFMRLIDSNFKLECRVFSKKGLFSSQEREMWVCKCGNEVDMKHQYCNNCRRDIYGFYITQINPPKAKSILQDSIEIISSSLFSSHP